MARRKRVREVEMLSDGDDVDWRPLTDSQVEKIGQKVEKFCKTKLRLDAKQARLFGEMAVEALTAPEHES